MSAYRKFSDTLREIEARGAAAPKPPKDAVSNVDAGRTLDALGALGGAEPETRNLSAADTARQSVAEGHSREAKGDFGDRAHDRLKHLDHLKPQASWGAAEEERAAIAEYEAGIPRAWAEGLARLHPDHPPADVPPKRWQQFIGAMHASCRLNPLCSAMKVGEFPVFGRKWDQPAKLAFRLLSCEGISRVIDD